MQIINDQIKELIDRQLNTYKDSARIQQDKNNEDDFKKSYRYREVLELIQNCIDEFDDNGDNNNILINLHGNIFEIYNTGNPFLTEGIRSLMIANVSPKKQKKYYKDTGYIGNKGLGFRSVLNWASDIKIMSANGLSIEFNQNNSNNFYENRNLQGDFAVFSYPKSTGMEIEEIKKELDCYSTKITLTLFDDKIEDVINQLNSIDYNTLLFLPKINALKITVNDSWKTFTKITEKKVDLDYEDVIIEFSDSSGFIKSESYRVYETIEQTPSGETINIKVSYHSNIDTSNNPLYSYFKLGIKLPIKWKINANFELTEEREKLKKTELNRKILERMIDFLFECAEKEATLISPADFTVLLSLIPEAQTFNEDNLSIVIPKSPAGVDNSFYFTEYYKREILNFKFLPLLNSEYSRYVDEPTSFNTSLIEKLIFDEKSKADIIKEPIPELISNFIKTKLIKHIDFEKINKHLIDSIEKYDERIDLAILFYKEFEREIQKQSLYKHTIYKDLPNFFQNIEGKTISNGNIFYTTQQNALRIPSYVSIDFLESKHIDYIQEKLEYQQGTRFYATPFGKVFGFHEYVFKAILSKTNTALSKQKDYDNKIYEYLLFLMSAEKKDRENKDHEFFLLNRNNELKKSSDLYLGYEYDNKQLDDLYVKQNDLFVKDFSSLNLKYKDLVNLFLEIGVSQSPRRIPENERFIHGNYIHPYLEFINNKHFDEYVRNPYLTEIKYTSFDRYLDILENASNFDIIKWLLSILNSMDENDTTIGFKWASKINPRQIKNLRSYFLYQIGTLKWYSFGNKKFSLNQIILYKNLGNKYEGLLGITEEELFAGNLDVHKDLRDKFKRIFDIKNDFSELDDDELYKLLNNIEKIDDNGQIAKKIYLDIETNKKDGEKPKSSDEQNKFFKDGKIFCYDNKYHNINDRIPNKKVYYANKYVLKSIEKKRNLMFYSRRKSSTVIKNWFNVELLDQNVNVTQPKINSVINHEFQQEIEQIKKYVLAIRMSETTTEASHQLAKNKNNFKIYPCSEIYNDEDIYFDDFEFCKSGSDYYIKISNNFESIDEIRKNSRYCSSVAEIIQTAHDLKDDFRDKIIKLIPFDEENRKEQFKVEYNDDSLLESATSEYISNAERLLLILNNFGIQPTENDRVKLEQIIIEDYKIKEGFSIKILQEIIEKNGMSLRDFNNFSNIAFDFTRTNEEAFLKFAQQNENKYMSYMFNQGQIDETNFSTQQIEYYESYTTYIAKNDLNFNVEHEYLEYYGIDDMKWADTKIVDFTSIGNHNVKHFDSEKYNQLEKEYKPDQIQIYAQFGKLDELYNQINAEKLDDYKEVNRAEVDYCSLFNSIKNGEEVVIDLDEFEKAEFKDNTSRETRNRVPRVYEPDNDSKQLTGFIAEAAALKYLTNTEKNYDKIEWISGNAVKAKFTTIGDDTAGYDMRVRFKNGHYKYFEIKGSIDDFHKIEITTNEIEKGQRHPKDYFIIFVKVNLDEQKAKYIKQLGNIFDFRDGETLSKNNKFTVKAKTHTLYFKKVVKNIN